MVGRAFARLNGTALAQLLRLPLAVMVALTAITGALLLRAPTNGLTLWAVGSGVFLLTAAGSVLNQLQERTSDALLRRTAGRPLACGQLSPAAGSGLGLSLASGGLAVLLAGTGAGPALLGLAALTWYLLVYTPLKRLTSLAVLAGTPCGALPPLIGWLAGGGPLPAPQPLALALIMLLWQVPHYWLLALPDRAELHAAGFRTLPELTDRQLLTVSRRWIGALALATVFLPLLAMPTHTLAQGLLIGLALALAGGTVWMSGRTLFAAAAAPLLRHLLHLYLGLILMVLAGDTLFPLSP